MVKVLLGTATLEVHPWHWNEGGPDRACAVLRALWAASPLVVGVTVNVSGVASVELVIPEDGSVNFATLERQMLHAANEALR